MENLLVILLGAAFTFVGLAIISELMKELFYEFKGEKGKKTHKIWYIVLGVISLVLNYYYETVEAVKIYEPQPIDEITYLGKTSIFLTSLYVFVVAAIITIIAIVFLLAIFKKNKDNFQKYILIIALVAGILEVFLFYAGPKNIDSIFARDKFITTCTVNAFPEDSEAKNYRLKADIRIDNGNVLSYGEKEIFILKVYFPNGGYIYSDDQETEDFSSDRTIRLIEDQDGRTWEIEIPKAQ